MEAEKQSGEYPHFDAVSPTPPPPITPTFEKILVTPLHSINKAILKYLQFVPCVLYFAMKPQPVANQFIESMLLVAVFSNLLILTISN